MNQENARGLVDNYLSCCKIEPLSFVNVTFDFLKHKYSYNDIEFYDLVIDENNKLQDVIKRVLDYTLDYASVVKGKGESFETYSGCLRSSIDIWRHIKKYNPNITIYEVMKCIHDYFDAMELYNHNCCTIERRVFRISDDNDYRPEMFDKNDADEFGLRFCEWGVL